MPQFTVDEGVVWPDLMMLFYEFGYYHVLYDYSNLLTFDFKESHSHVYSI